MIKSQFLKPHKPPENTGDIHQNQLKVPFDAQKFEARLDELKLTVLFDEQQKVEVGFLIFWIDLNFMKFKSLNQYLIF